jgi:hypothetical protein
MTLTLLDFMTRGKSLIADRGVQFDNVSKSNGEKFSKLNGRFYMNIVYENKAIQSI